MTTALNTLYYAPTLGLPTRPKPSFLPLLCIVSLTLILAAEAFFVFAPAFTSLEYRLTAPELIPMAGLVFSGLSIGLSAVPYYLRWERITLFTLGTTALLISAACLIPQYTSA